MKPLFIALAVVVLGGVGYMAYSQLDNNPGHMSVTLPTATSTDNTPTPSGKKIAFSELVKQGGSYECTVKQAVSNMDSDGVVFMNRDRIRGEFSTLTQGIKIDTSMIVKDGYTYTWSSMMPGAGFKIKMDSPTGAGAHTTADAETSTNGSYSWNADQIGDYYCKEWAVDESKFTLPTSVKFTEIKK